MNTTVGERNRGHGFFTNLVGLYSAPGPEFTAILPKPSFLKPLLALVALNVLFTGVWLTRVDIPGFFTAQNERTKHWSETPPEQRARVLAVQTKIFRPIAAGSALLGAPILILVVATWNLFVFRFFLATDVTFKQSLTIVTWSIFAIALVTTPLVLLTLFLKGDWSLDPRNALQASLAGAFDPETAPKALYSLARAMDVFVFWILFLLIRGYQAATSTRTGVAAAAILIPWLLWILGQAALSAIF